jgi:hypothetical protein
MPVLRKQVQQILESAKPSESRLEEELRKEESTIVLGHPADPFSSPSRAYESHDREETESPQSKPDIYFTRPIDGTDTPALLTGRTKLDSAAGSPDRGGRGPLMDEQDSPLPLPVRIKSTFAAATPALHEARDLPSATYNDFVSDLLKTFGIIRLKNYTYTAFDAILRLLFRNVTVSIQKSNMFGDTELKIKRIQNNQINELG